jgi:hypothetical protein
MQYFDLHDDFGLACLVEKSGDLLLDLNGIAVRTWPSNEGIAIWGLAWFDRNEVVFDLVSDSAAAIVSSTSWSRLELGCFNQILLSPKYIFVTYNEEVYYSSKIGELERNVLSIFSRSGKFELALAEFLENDRDGDDLDEVDAGYTFSNTLIFVGYPSHLLWIFDAAARTYRKIPVPFSLVCIHVMSGDDKRAYAIFDNRNVMQDHPERVPFELAIFDLIAEKSIKHDFAPVEKELIASGFKMDALKFQPSSTGKIIVSDGEKAAFLEFSDDV